MSKKFGGARRDRTADLLHAMQALSQLSYGPDKAINNKLLAISEISILMQGGKMYVSPPALSSSGTLANVVQGPVQSRLRSIRPKQSQGDIDGGGNRGACYRNA